MGPSPLINALRQGSGGPGRHEIVCPLGEGGMAHVFLGMQRGAFDATKLVVLKKVRSEFVGDEEFLAMFVNEARLSLRFNHPNVVHTYEVIAEAPEFCLVMEYLEGQTLSQVLRRVGREQFPLDLHVWILSQVLAGLGYAHSLKDFDGSPLGVVHRDISPSNVFITSAGEVKLLDFGIATAAGAISMTQKGMVKGKLGYAAPEQCMAQPSDARSDLYAAGVMLWEAVAMRRRAVAETQFATLRARIDGSEPAIEAVVPDVCDELREACRVSLEREPAQRIATAEEFEDLLDTYLAKRELKDPAQTLAGIIRGHFSEELALVRQAIEAHAGASGRASGRLALEATTNTNVSAAPLVRSVAAEGTKSSMKAVSFRPQRSSTAWLAGAGLILGVAGLVAALRSFAPPVASSAATGSTAAVGAPSPSSAQLARAASEKATVDVKITATPDRTRLTLDGQPIDNPYRAQLPSDDREHELVAELDGRVKESRRLHLDRELDLLLELGPPPKNAKERAPASGRAAASGSAFGTGTSGSERASSSARETAPAAQSGSTPQPGTDLAGGRGALRGRFDEKDPYSQ